MKKPILLILSLLLFAGIAFADNVVTYTYDSAGNRITKVVSSPSNCNNVELSICLPDRINSSTVVNLKGTIWNNSNRKIAFYDYRLFNSLYHPWGTDWTLSIFKDGDRLYFEYVDVVSDPPKLIRLNKGESYSFMIPISFEFLSEIPFLPAKEPLIGGLDVQLSIHLKKPRDTTITSNHVNIYLSSE